MTDVDAAETQVTPETVNTDSVTNDVTDSATEHDNTTDTNEATPETQGDAPQNDPTDNATDEAKDIEPDTQDDTQDDTPEWFMKDKYKSVEEQAKSAYELQKKMGKFWGAPNDNYTVEDIEGITKDDPLLENLMPALKDIGLSQEGFSHLVKQYQDANVSMMKKFEAELKEELTTKDAATYQAVDKWMTQNLTPEEREQVQQNWLMTAADFKLFNQMRLMAAPSTSVPSSSDGNAPRFESSKEVENDKIKYRKEVSQKLRVPDKNYENDLAQRYRDARTRELRSK